MPQSINFGALGQEMTKVGQKGLDTASQTVSVSRSGNQRTNGLTQLSQSRTAGSQLKAVKAIASATNEGGYTLLANLFLCWLISLVVG